MNTTTTQARAAAEYASRIGQDIDLTFELAEYAETEAEAERLERLEAEGRREMYFMLDLEGY